MSTLTDKAIYRLDIIHHIYLLALGDKLHLAPIDPNPQWILDVGTGTGIWAIDAGEVPPNVEFQIDDAESDWTFKPDFFDLVHMRNLGGAVKNWDKLLGEAYKYCKPGGWIYMAEYEMAIFSDDGTLDNAPELQKYYELVSEAAEKTGRSFYMSKRLKPAIERAGFEKVHHQGAKIPLGPWAADRKQKELGAYVLLSAETGFEAFGIQLFTNVLEMKVEDANTLIQATLRQAKSRKIHSYTMQ
ncbi:hypothetical protein Q9L58_004854 [Maublancomyces gigas]|uniref:S-adenosyl-L-methionine-dependent methyltransferase n=1 Tax=Discina gigas TaxID=1032678 RepID=A0ABR3GJR0_9PEZI